MTSRCMPARRRATTFVWSVLALAAMFTGPAGQAAETHYAAPTIINDGWRTGDLSTTGFDDRRLRALLARMMDGRTNLHSVIVERHGRLVAEVYRRGRDESVYLPIGLNSDFGPTVLHDTRSVGKSIVGLLVGIARQQGKLGDLATPAIS